MASGFWDALEGAFDEIFAPAAQAEPPNRDPGIGREYSATFKVIIPTTPEGFSNATVSATRVCSYAPGEGDTLGRREAVEAREIESLRNSLLEEGERLRRGLATGAYATTRATGIAPSRRPR